MTTYRLPDWMGGTEAALIGGVEEDGTVRLGPLRDGVMSNARVTISVDEVTEVEASLPAEPPVGAVMLDGGDVAWQRVQDDGSVLPWRHDGDRRSWEEMLHWGPLTLLVPDPVASAPELPWEYRDEDRIRFGVDLHSIEPLVSFDSTCPRYYMPLDTAEQMALAILRAAREARAAS